jgi:predicted Zn-ribbon and HTH transcriptional regulator
MRSLARGLWNVITFVSLLAGVVVCAVWVRGEYACDVVRRADAAGADSAFCSASGVVQFTRTCGTSQLVLNPFTNTGGLLIPPAPPKIQQAWQWLRSPPSQAPFSLIDPVPTDAVLDARVLVLVARSVPVYAPGGYSGFQPALPVATAAVMSIAAPDWFLAVLAAVLPTLRAVAWHTARRRARLAGRAICAKCGYDMRATPERCPECGTRKS